MSLHRLPAVALRAARLACIAALAVLLPAAAGPAQAQAQGQAADAGTANSNSGLRLDLSIKTTADGSAAQTLDRSLDARGAAAALGVADDGDGIADPVAITTVLQRVFESHPSVREAESLAAAEEIGVEGARAGLYPYLQVSSALANQRDNGLVTISAVQPLWDGGRTFATVRQTKSQVRSAGWNLQNVRLQLGDEVLLAAFDILAAEDQIRLFERYLVELEESRLTIERRAEQGVAPDADVQTVLVRISQAQAGRETIRAQRIAARSRLSSLLNGPPPDLRWPDTDLRVSPDELDELLSEVERNPLVRIDEQAVITQQATADATKAAIWPQLSLQHRQQLSGREFDPSNDATLLVVQYQTTNGYQAYQGYNADRARVESARRKLDATKAALQAQFRSDFVQYLTALTQYSTQLNAARSLEELVASYRRQFDVGRKTWLELLNAQREAHDARMQLINFKRGYWQSDLRIMLQAMQWQRLGLDAYLDPADAAAIKLRGGQGGATAPASPQSANAPAAAAEPVAAPAQNPTP